MRWQVQEMEGEVVAGNTWTGSVSAAINFVGSWEEKDYIIEMDDGGWKSQSQIHRWGDKPRYILLWLEMPMLCKLCLIMTASKGLCPFLWKPASGTG